MRLLCGGYYTFFKKKFMNVYVVQEITPQKPLSLYNLCWIDGMLLTDLFIGYVPDNVFY